MIADAPEADAIVETQAFLTDADQQFQEDVTLDGATATDDARCYLSRDGSGALNPWIRCGPAAFSADDPPWFTYPTDTVRVDSFDTDSPLTLELAGSHTPGTEVDGLELLFRPDGQTPSNRELVLEIPEPLEQVDGFTRGFAVTCDDGNPPCGLFEALPFGGNPDTCVLYFNSTELRVWVNGEDEHQLHDMSVTDMVDELDDSGVEATLWHQHQSGPVFGHHPPEGVYLSAYVANSVDLGVLADAVATTATQAAFVAVESGPSRGDAQYVGIEAKDENAARAALARYISAAGGSEVPDKYIEVYTIELAHCPTP